MRTPRRLRTPGFGKNVGGRISRHGTAYELRVLQTGDAVVALHPMHARERCCALGSGEKLVGGADAAAQIIIGLPERSIDTAANPGSAANSKAEAAHGRATRWMSMMARAS